MQFPLKKIDRIQRKEATTITEEWIPIINYEGIYSISNYGNVRKEKRISYRTVNGKTRPYPHKQQLIKTALNTSGYSRVVLWKDGKSKKFFVHRLVAEHFVENNDFKPVVNHKDGIKVNNHYINLEWLTHSENNIHAIYELSVTPDTSGIHDKRKVKQLDKITGQVLAEFESIKEAQNATNVSHISSVCRGVRHTAGGYKWEYA